jgi:hypothetical protein
MDERILVNRFSLGDPDWDLLDCDLSDEPEEPEEQRSERWLGETPTAPNMR